jgi:uncharacterized protein (TIGR02118 family)
VIRLLFGWKDRPDRTPEECEAHYRAVHIPLAQRAFDGVPGFVSLRYSRVRECRVNDFNRRESRPDEPDMDAWVELAFTDDDRLQAAFARPELQALFDDHPNFMAVDNERNIVVYRVDRTTILDARGSVEHLDD